MDLEGLIHRVARENSSAETSRDLFFDEPHQRSIIPSIAQELINAGEEPKKVSVVWYANWGDFIIVTGDGFLPFQKNILFEISIPFPIRGEETWYKGDLIATVSSAKGNSRGGPDSVDTSGAVVDASIAKAASSKGCNQRITRSVAMAEAISTIRKEQL
jgi:hypothetical protein